MKTKDLLAIVASVVTVQCGIAHGLAADALLDNRRELPAEWGTIGIRISGQQPYVCYGQARSARAVTREIGQTMSVGANAAGDMVQNSGEMAFVALFAAPPVVALYTLPQVPGIVLGGVNGGVSKKTMQEAEAAFPPALKEFGLWEGLPGWIVEAAPPEMAKRMVALPPVNAGSNGTRQVFTILNVEVLGMGVKQRSSSRASRELVVSTYLTLRLAGDDQVLWSDAVEFHGGRAYAHTVAKWAAQDGRLLREEFGRCRQELPRLVVGRLSQSAGVVRIPQWAGTASTKAVAQSGK